MTSLEAQAAGPGRRLARRLRSFLAGTASLADISGTAASRTMRNALPPADDWSAVGGCFTDAGKLLRDTMPDHGHGPARHRLGTEKGSR